MNQSDEKLYEDFRQKIRNFQESRILLTAVELDLFTAIGNGRETSEIAEIIKADPRGTEMLLNALVAIDILTKKDNRFYNTSMTQNFLTAGAPEASRMSLMHSVYLWESWSTLTDCVREGTAVKLAKKPKRDKADTEAFIAAMHHNASNRASEVIAAVGTEKVGRLLDIGGGSGAYSIAFAKAKSDLKAEILDLESVKPLAEEYIGKAGLSDRISVRAGDMHTGEYGTGFDMALLSAICHMNSPEQNIHVLEKIHAALNPGGRVVIQDFILNEDRTAPRNAAIFAINMLVNTRKGNSYSEREYRDWLQGAGFSDIVHIDLSGPTGLVVGQK